MENMENADIVGGQRRLIMNADGKKGIAKQMLRSTAECGTEKLLLYPNSCNLKHRKKDQAEPMSPEGFNRLEGWMTDGTGEDSEPR